MRQRRGVALHSGVALHRVTSVGLLVAVMALVLVGGLRGWWRLLGHQPLVPPEDQVPEEVQAVTKELELASLPQEGESAISFPVTFEAIPEGSCPPSWLCIGEHTQVCRENSVKDPCEPMMADTGRYFSVGDAAGPSSAVSPKFRLPQNIDKVSFRINADVGSCLRVYRASDETVLCTSHGGEARRGVFEQTCSGLTEHKGEVVYIFVGKIKSDTVGKVMVDDICLQDFFGRDINLAGEVIDTLFGAAGADAASTAGSGSSALTSSGSSATSGSAGAVGETLAPIVSAADSMSTSSLSSRSSSSSSSSSSTSSNTKTTSSLISTSTRTTPTATSTAETTTTAASTTNSEAPLAVPQATSTTTGSEVAGITACADEADGEKCFTKTVGYMPPFGKIKEDSLTLHEASAKCLKLHNCCGFMVEGDHGDAVDKDVRQKVYFKTKCGSGAARWTSFATPVANSFAQLLGEEESPDSLHAEHADHRHGEMDHHHRESHDNLHAEHATQEPVGVAAVDVGVSIMLLGSVLFHTCLFYLVNHSDADMRRHTWAVLSATISIFSAVLVFSGMMCVVRAFAHRVIRPMTGSSEQEGNEVFVIVVEYIMMFMWFTALHWYIWKFAAESVNRKQVAKQANNYVSVNWYMADLVEESAPTESPQMLALRSEQKMKCWAQLLAHMSGFAAISGGYSMQGLPIFSSTERRTMSFVPVVFSGVGLSLLFRLSDYIRAWCSKDGTRDAVSAKWDAAAEEAENEFGGLSLSFLLVQALIFCLTGSLTTSHENREHRRHHAGPHHHYTHLDSLVLLFLALFFAGVTVFMVWCRSGGSEEVEVEREEENANLPVLGNCDSYTQRWFYIAQTTCAMSFAWCLLYAVEWEIEHYSRELGFIMISHSVQQTICALIISFMSFGLIRILDLIEDMKSTGETADKCARSMIEAMAVLIAFSWEHAFYNGVEAIADLFHRKGYWAPVLMKVTLALAVALVIVPAWRIYILKTVMDYDRMHKEEKAVARSNLDAQ